VYVKLSQLQELADRKGRINTVYVRAESADDVTSVAGQIEKTVEGASVTTADDLAERVSGTLVDAKNLAGKLGTALMVVGLLAAFLGEPADASSVTANPRARHSQGARRSQRLVVRQVTGESPLRLDGSRPRPRGRCATAASRALRATVPPPPQGPGFRRPRSVRQGGAGRRDGGRPAPVSVGLILGAVGLAVLGGPLPGGRKPASVAHDPPTPSAAD
jgi:hypothetical protein